MTLHTHIEENLPCLWVEPTRIRQDLFNLLNNAARFTEQGNVTVQHIPIVIVSAQDEIDHQLTLKGSMMIVKEAGLKAGEVVQWVQKVLDTATRTWSPREATDERQMASSMAT